MAAWACGSPPSFVIWIGSTLGTILPILAKRHRSFHCPEWVFFIARYFGSGVIIATAYIHLLSPAEEALRDPCLTGPITEYDWVSGIILMTFYVLFFVDLMVTRYSRFGAETGNELEARALEALEQGVSREESALAPNDSRDAKDPTTVESIRKATATFTFDEYRTQLTSIFVLEFGVVFHSIFIGLTLAVSGSEFITLFIVVVFHQTFEGIGLGARLAVAPWPRDTKWTPYIPGWLMDSPRRLRSLPG